MCVTWGFIVIKMIQCYRIFYGKIKLLFIFDVVVIETMKRNWFFVQIFAYYVFS